MSSDEKDIQRRFKPLTAVESSDQTTFNKREIITYEKHLEENSNLTEIGQYLERGKKKLREKDCSQRVDRAMEAYQEVYVEQISDGLDEHSEEGTPPRRQPESVYGQGSSSVDPSCVQTQAAADPNFPAQAVKEADNIRKERDSLALDQIRSRGKIMDLERKIAELSSVHKSKADHSGDFRTRNGSPESVSNGPNGQRFRISQSGDTYERVSRDESNQLAPVVVEAIGAESGSANKIPADNDSIAATSGRLIKNIQDAFSVVFSEIKSLRQGNESGLSKNAQSGSQRQSRQVSALSRSSGRGTDQESSHDLERPSSSMLRSNQFLPFDSLEEQNSFMDEQLIEDGVQRDEDIEDDILDVHPEDDDLYEDDE